MTTRIPSASSMEKLNDVERLRVITWCSQHSVRCPDMDPELGFNDGGIVTLVTLQCCRCKEVASEITDLDNL